MDKSKIDNAISAHCKWVMRLLAAIETGGSEFDPKTVKTDNNCEFGKWMYGELAAEIGASPIFTEIKTFHAKFHQAAAAILELALQGRKDEAVVLLRSGGDFKNAQDALIRKLKELREKST